MSDRYTRGMEIRRQILGDRYVDQAEADKNDFNEDFQRFITEFAWGTVWARDGLDRRTRHLLTIAMLVCLGKEDELAMHVRAARNTGVTRQDLKEVFQHAAVYAGVPAANRAFHVAEAVFAEWDAIREEGSEP